jgi:hypothetical protein
MNDKTEIVHRNAKAVMQTMDDQNLKISDLQDEVSKAHERITMMEQQVALAVQRVNQIMAMSFSGGRTDGA